MDIDAYAAAHRDQWGRLDELTRRRRLDGKSTDELVGLYRTAASHLSRIRAGAPDTEVLAEVSGRVAAARGRITGTREVRLSDLRRFWLCSAPAALYRVRRWTIGVMLVEIALAVVVALWTLHSPEAMSALGTPEQLDDYASSAFEAYYSEYAPSEFAAQVWTNNARLAAICIAGGITGVVPVDLLANNAISVGQAAAIMADHGMLDLFFILITPHGLLELTCIFVAGGAGLRLFWTLLVPGPRSRSAALAVEGRALITVAVVLTVALGVSGLVEAFVTPAPIPWAVKLVVGVLALAVLWTYTYVPGRRAALAGATGDLDEEEAGASLAEAG